MSSIFPTVRKKSRYLDTFDIDLDSFFPTSWSEPTFSTPPVKSLKRSSYASSPRANVTKSEGGYGIELAVPGFSRDEFKIEIEDNVLSISMEIGGTSMPASESAYVTREYNYSSFTRSWALPEGASTENVTAQYNAGILTVYVPVEKDEPTIRRISVD